MSTQDSLPVATRGIPDHQPPGDRSSISSLSADDHVADRSAPLLDEIRPTNLGPHEQVASMTRLPAISNGRFSRVGSVCSEPATHVQPVEQDPGLTEENHHYPRSEARSHTGTAGGEYKIQLSLSKHGSLTSHRFLSTPRSRGPYWQL